MTNTPREPAEKKPTLPRAEDGAHEKAKDEEIKSRSADPGQSSYGGFANEDTRRQAQDLGNDKPSNDKK